MYCEKKVQCVQVVLICIDIMYASWHGTNLFIPEKVQMATCITSPVSDKLYSTMHPCPCSQIWETKKEQ